MDPIANTAVHVRPSTDGRALEEPEEVWDGLVRTVSRLTGRSKRESDAEKYAQAGDGDTFTHPHLARVDEEDSFPEGGTRAWLVVLSAWLLLFPSLGLQVSLGLLQDYWSQHQLAHLSASTIGWIPSVFVYLSLAGGLFVGPLFDRYGPRWIALCGSLAELLMVFLLAECRTFWQMMLCCGVLGGIAGALLMTTSLAVVAHWFKQRRGLTQGIAMMGSSCGGLVIPLMLRTTFPKYGYTWSLRILGFVFLLCFTIGNILIKARLPPSANTKKRSIVSLSIYADLRLSFLTISVFGFEVVLFGALGILPTYATLSTTFSADTGFFIIATLNGVSCLGRILPGYVADKIGRFNTLAIMIVFTLVFMLVLWLPFGSTSLPALYTFSALFGFGTGSWMALTPACVGQLCRADEFGRYYGSMYFIASLATLICIPISGELVEKVGPQPMVGFLTAILALSLIACLFSRWACLGRQWTLKAKV
ncbi:major facilitator superfamily domain-containing protein [Boeremia exigua]|uniref:major facilitator superfamily domain-containing protein n=1 Tax=Boeremia exigua TaxID=749465 RepID=UPI001E8E3290|nr:major facilitator superfamily domain-containing protein [Boeremia exigua]KAH6616418.1 major facilitator superfamily domain-containing protein [Boeremia exigua]